MRRWKVLLTALSMLALRACGGEAAFASIPTPTPRVTPRATPSPKKGPEFFRLNGSRLSQADPTPVKTPVCRMFFGGKAGDPDTACNCEMGPDDQPHCVEPPVPAEQLWGLVGRVLDAQCWVRV